MERRNRLREYVVETTLLVFFVALLWPGVSFGQGTMAGMSVITGRVTDPTGAAIPSATVDVTSVATGVTTKFVTNGDGLFRTSPLAPGTYTIVVTAAGFKTLTRSDILLQIGQTANIECPLQVGSTTQNVTIRATPPLVNTTTPTQASIVQSNIVRNMPLINRTAGQLIGLTPGVFFTYVDNGSFGAPRFNEGATGDFSYFIDGFPAGASRTNVDQGEVNPTAESVHEVRVENGLSGVTTGYAEGGSVFYVLKSGGSRYHGSGYYYMRNTALDTANFWSHTVLNDEWYMGGGSIGGPLPRRVFKSRPAFFYVNFEGDDESNPGASVLTIPTMAERSGNFQGLAPIYDPTTTQLLPNGSYTRQQFSCNGQLNVICPGRIDPVMAKTLADWPTIPASVTNPVNDYTATYSSIIHDVRWVGKINWHITNKDHFTFDTLYLRGNTGTTALSGFKPYADPIGSHFYPEMSGLYGFSETHIFGANLINNASFEYRPRYWIPNIAGHNPSAKYAESLGIKGYVPGEDLGFPTFNFSGYQTLGPGLLTYAQNLSTVDYGDNLDWIRGKHFLTFGAQVEEARPHVFGAVFPTGDFNFNQTATALPPQGPTQSFTGGDGFATSLIGWASGVSLESNGVSSYRQWYAAPFVTDTWRIKSDLTINFGLRWDIDFPLHQTYYGTSASSPGPGVVAGSGFDATAINPVCNCPGEVTFLGRNGVFSGFYHTDWHRVMPQVGFAFAPSMFHNHLAIRGGYGVYSIDPSLGTNLTAPALGFSTDVSFSTPSEGTATSPVFYMNQGIPPYPVGGSPSVLKPGYGAVPPPYTRPTTGVSYVSPNWRFGYTQDLGLTIDYELPRQYVVGIVGQAELARKLPMIFDEDQLAPSSGLWALQGNFQADRPFPQFGGVSNIKYAEGTIDWYGLTLEVNKHYSNGLSLAGSYQWAKGVGIMGCESSYLCGLSRSAATFYQAANAQTGIPFGRFNANFNYDLPWGPGRPFLQHGAASKVLGGWSVSSIFTWASGIPFGIGSTSNSLNCFCGLGHRADRVSNPAPPSHPLHTTAEWFNTNAFAAPAFGQIGDVGGVILTGPAMFSWDAEIYKTIKFGEDRSLKISGDFFNFTNTPKLGPPDATLGSPGFGVISGPLVAPYAGAGASNDDSARLVQVGLHFYF